MNFNDALDIASCVVLPQDAGQKLGFTQVLLDTDVPNVGDVVYMFSHDTHSLEETVAPVDATGAGQAIQISRSISIRAGVVTGVYQHGYRQYKWPCFTTTIPAEPGMSGGFVARRIDGPIAACGIVCADASTEDSRSDYLKPGESIIASAWPALALQLPLVFPMETPPIKPIFKFMTDGHFPLPVGGLDHISIEQQQNDDWSIQRLGRLPR